MPNSTLDIKAQSSSASMSYTHKGICGSFSRFTLCNPLCFACSCRLAQSFKSNFDRVQYLLALHLIALAPALPLGIGGGVMSPAHELGNYWKTHVGERAECAYDHFTRPSQVLVAVVTDEVRVLHVRVFQAGREYAIGVVKFGARHGRFRS